MTDQTPSLELFTSRSSNQSAWARDFVASLGLNIPAQIPSGEGVAQHPANIVRQAAVAQGKRVAIRTVNGELWACWIGDL